MRLFNRYLDSEPTERDPTSGEMQNCPDRYWRNGVLPRPYHLLSGEETVRSTSTAKPAA